MRILITGGLGYIGARLAKYLSENTSETIIIGTRKKNIDSVSWLPNIKIVNTIWSSNTDLEKICQNIDVVIHSAGLNSSECYLNPSLALEVNGFSTERLLKASIKKRVKRFIYISSAHVYKSPLNGKINEKSSCINNHPYATSHKAGEDAVRFANSIGEIEGVVIRLSNSFGRPVHLNTNCWALLANDITKQAFKNNEMILRSSTLERRDFISLNNVCRCLEHLISLPSSKLLDGLFNVGGGWTPTILDIAKILVKRIHIITDKDIEIIYKKFIPGSSNLSLEFDISKIKSTGFNLVNDTNKEFDNLIKFCHKSFGV